MTSYSMKVASLVAFATCLGAAFSQNRDARSTHDSAATHWDWISSELHLGDQPLDAELIKPFEEDFLVGVASPNEGAKRTLHRCSDYLAVRDSITDMGPSVTANALRATGTRCDALDLLNHARRAPRPCFANFTFKRLAIHNLPAELALTVSREDERYVQQASQRGLPLTAVAGRAILRASSADDATVSVPSAWTSRLIALARADFLGDGREELMVRSTSWVEEGTFQTSHLFLLGCRTRSKVLPVVLQR